MGAVKLIEVPDDLFEDLEALRRSMRKSRVEVLRELLRRERARRAFLHYAKKQERGPASMSDQEIMELAVQETDAVRRLRASKRRKT
jgi:predicted CopG family antitoxin